MLQQNGIEDLYPLEATIEYEHTKQLPKPIIATENTATEKSSFSYEDPDDTRYNVQDMPEYNVETKADFKGNQEAAEWLMHDPNKYNVMPDEDINKLFSDGDTSSKGTRGDPTSSNSNEQDDINDSNTEEVYEKYDKYLNDVDQHISNKENDIEPDQESLQNVEEKESTTGSNDTDDETFLKDSSTESETNQSEQPNIDDSPSSSSNDNDSGPSDTTSDTQLNALEVKTSQDDGHVSRVEHQLADSSSHVENTKEKLENQEGKTVKAYDSTENLEKEDKDNNEKENSSHNNKATNAFFNHHAIQTNKAIERNPNLLPVYRVSHLHANNYKGVKLDLGAPLAESGTSRQLVGTNRHPLGVKDFRPQPYNLYSGIAQIIASRGKDEQAPMTFSADMHQTHPLHYRPNPQTPVVAQGRHGIPSKFGEWNGWSKCSVSCASGSQMRARICMRLPCQSNNLYQTQICTRDVCPDKWRTESLEAHNHIRALHHSPPLAWSHFLADEAKHIANTLASRDYIGSQDLHEEKGENIAQLRAPHSTKLLAQEAVDLWYKEFKSYSYAYPELTPANRHFIQTIWKKTKSLGMAFTKSPSGEYTFVVALYGGPNIDNRSLRDNVLRTGKTHDVYTTFKRSEHMGEGQA